MLRWDVKIPDWSEGKPLWIENVEADTPEEAKAKVVAWVNERAGYAYCTDLPEGSIVRPAWERQP